MIGIFKQKSPGNIAILLIFGMLLKLPIFLYPRNITSSLNDGRLFQYFLSIIPKENGLGLSFLTFFLLYVQGLMINYIVNEYRLIPKQNYLPAMAYLIITSLLPEWNYLSSPLVSNTLIIWMIISVFKLYNVNNIKARVFNIGLIAGLSSYIYFPSGFFIICVMVAVLILRPFRLNELVLFIVGSITPYYFHFIILFLQDRLSIANFFPHISFKIPDVKSNIWLAASTLLLTIPFLIGGYFVQVHLRKMLIQGRKNWSILLLYLMMAFFIPFINSDQSFHTWILIAAPFATFHACTYYYPSKRFLPLLLFFISIGYIFYQQYGLSTWHA